MDQNADVVAQEHRAHDRLMARADIDPQLGRLRPIDAVTAAIREPGLSYRQVIATVLEGYADRPAFGTRCHEIRQTAPGGPRVRHALPAYETMTFREVAERTEAIAAFWQRDPRHRVDPGDFVALIAFTGAEMAITDFACVYVQAITVPVQANLPQVDGLQILSDIAPVLLIASIDNLDRAVGYALAQPGIRSLFVIEADEADDADREQIRAARERLAQAGDRTALVTFAQAVAAGRALSYVAPPNPPDGLDALSMIIFTSGSTGTPKGAMIHEAIAAALWTAKPRPQPTIGIAYCPMNHLMGRGMIHAPLGQGGTVMFTHKSDMSTLLDDIRLIRPTSLVFIPRVCEIIYQNYQSDVQRRINDGESPAEADAAVRAEMRRGYLGDRLFAGNVGSSPTAPEIRAFIASCFDISLLEAYGSTECGTVPVTIQNIVQRPNVIDYKLVDVPELGYHNSDTPFPRGELSVRTALGIRGYFKRPDTTAATIDANGFVLTGDIMEERGPDHLVWIDRRNNVIKLSQAEFVTIGPLEAAYLGGSAMIGQIYLYGSSYRPFLLAVVVPDMTMVADRLGHPPTEADLRSLILAEFQRIARSATLKSFEVPRDVLIEPEPFSPDNGLLSSVGKPLRPKLKLRYGDRLEALYQEIERQQQAELTSLRDRAGGLTTPDRVAGAFKANLGIPAIDPAGLQSYTDLGGDSLGAVSLSLLLEEIFSVNVPVSIILHPACTVRRIADYVTRAQAMGAGGAAASFIEVHGAEGTRVRTADLTVARLLGAQMIAQSQTTPLVQGDTLTVLLTGANGYLGRFVCLEWMERLAPIGGKVICLTRGASPAAARQRLIDAYGTRDRSLAARVRDLAADCLEVVVGDLAAPRLGLDDAQFAELAEQVDRVVHSGALVNHMLSYRNLFEPNVVGTAELIRFALTARRKRFDYVSSIAVPHLIPALARGGEDMDVRDGAAELPISDAYASGYAMSKWAGEVLLRDAHATCGLPVTVFRPGMILAHTRFTGQINVPDMFTRLLFSLVQTGIAPFSFYELPSDGSRPQAHYDGLPVDFIAAAMQQIGARRQNGFATYNFTDVHAADGISLDQIVDWIVSAGYPIRRIKDYPDWLQRFAERMRHLPDNERQHSVLPILAHFNHPHQARPMNLRSDNFVDQIRSIAAGPEVPRLREAFIHKCLSDVVHLGLLHDAREMAP